MKVFLSWSGRESHQVACIFRDWLPLVIQSLEPFISSDIEKGERWSADIARELEAANFGILCVTRENLESPWLHFEAGALSKTLNTARVAPFLFRLKRSDIPGKGPLVQFQSTIFESADVLRLVTSLNNALDESRRLELTRLEKSFSQWWPNLEKHLNELPEDRPALVKPTPTQEQEILEELLELARGQSRLLASLNRSAPSFDIGPDHRTIEAEVAGPFQAWLVQEYPFDVLDSQTGGCDFLLGVSPNATGYELVYLQSVSLAKRVVKREAARLGEMIRKGSIGKAYCVLVASDFDPLYLLASLDWVLTPGVGLIFGHLRKDWKFEEVTTIEPREPS